MSTTPAATGSGPQLTLPNGTQVSLVTPGRRFGCWLLSLLVVITIVGLFFHLWFIFRDKQSVGMKALKMIHVDEATGTPADPEVYKKYALRYIFSGISFGIVTLIGDLMIFGSERHQTLWDRRAGVLMVSTA